MKPGRKPPDLTGLRFGRWTVIKQEDTPRSGRYYWSCRCDCGIERGVFGPDLREGKNKSCGCHRRDVTTARNHKRAERCGRTREHGTLGYFKSRAWNSIRSRTGDWGTPTCDYYVRKGIKLLFNKEEFYAWCDVQWPIAKVMYEEGEKPTIDRIDNEGHYALDNIQVLTLYDNIQKKKPDRELLERKRATECT